MVSLRHVIHHDILHACLRCRCSDALSHALCVTVHCAIAYHKTILCLVTAHAVILGDNTVNMLVPYRTVSRADEVDIHSCEFLQCSLHRNAVFAHDIAVIAHHLKPEGVAVDLCVNDSTVQCTEASEGVAAEQCARFPFTIAAQRYHCLGPVNHWGEHELQFVCTEFERVAVLHLNIILILQTVETSHHAKGLLVSDDLYLRVVFLY